MFGVCFPWLHVVFGRVTCCCVGCRSSCLRAHPGYLSALRVFPCHAWISQLRWGPSGFPVLDSGCSNGIFQERLQGFPLSPPSWVRIMIFICFAVGGMLACLQCRGIMTNVAVNILHVPRGEHTFLVDTCLGMKFAACQAYMPSTALDKARLFPE